MVDLGSLLDRSRDALFAAAGQAASVGQTAAAQDQASAQDDSILSALMPRAFADSGIDMDFAFQDAPARMADWRTLMFWLVALVACIVIAASTNPNEASFRSYLTELSFRRHLVDIRSDDTSASDLPSTAHAAEDSKADGSTPVTPSSSLAVSSSSTSVQHASSSSGTDTPIAPFRFANHVSISLRTPTLYYKTLYVLSVALTSPLGPPAFLSDPITLVRNRGHVQKERLVLYVGYLGHWVQIGIVPRRLEWVWRAWFDQSKEKRKKTDRAGVTDLRAVQAKDDTASKNTLAPPSKNVRRIGSNSDLSSSHPAPLPIPSFPESRRASIVSLLPPPDTADSSPAVIALKGDLNKAQDALNELKGQLLSHEQSVSDAHASLQATLDDLRTRRKEDDAERSEIKSKTKGLEEQKRQAEAGKREAEKKLRAAEVARDTVLGKIEGAKRDMVDAKAAIEASERAARQVTEEGARYVVETQESVDSRIKELDDMEGETKALEVEVEELVERVKEAEERLKTTHQRGYTVPPPAGISPTAVAGNASGGTAAAPATGGSNAAAQSAAAAAVANAIVGKNLAPEEEMMMMAAAYEAAAQEGYHPHGSHSTHSSSNAFQHGHGHGQAHQNQHQHHGLSSGYTAHHAALGHGPGQHSNNSWASQAAAYMAEAGMPSLDQSYTARPTYPGRSISGNTATASGTAGALSSAGDGKRLTELMAFDDFGPGSASSQDHAHAHARDKRFSGEGFGQVLGLAANRLSAHAHAEEDDEISESELYGLDPASPNGGISTSFSANLLGQGLFNSLLGGDQTPTDGQTDDGTGTGDEDDAEEGTTLEEALNFGPAEVLLERERGADDGEVGSDEDTDHEGEATKSPLSDGRHFSPAQGQGLGQQQVKQKRFSFSRLVPPTTSPLNPARVPSATPSNTSSTAPSAHAPTSASTASSTPAPPAIPALSALPALPGSRRWFSGTMSASAENLHSFPYHNHPSLVQSSDSLASHSHAIPGQSVAGGAHVNSNTGHGQGQIHHSHTPGSGASTTTAGSLYESSPFAPSESERKKLMGLGGMWGQMGMGGLGKRFSTPPSAAAQPIQGHGHGHGLLKDDAPLGRSTSLDLAPHSRGQSAPVGQPRSFMPLSSANPGTGTVTSGSAASALAGTSPQSQQSWMARHLHLQSSLGNGSFGSGTSDSGSSQPVPIGSGHSHSNSHSHSHSASGGMRSFFGSSPGSSKLGSSPNASMGFASGANSNAALSTSPANRFENALQAIAGSPKSSPNNAKNKDIEKDANNEEDGEGDKKDGRFKLFSSLRKPSVAKLGSSPGAQSNSSATSDR